MTKKPQSDSTNFRVIKIKQAIGLHNCYICLHKFRGRPDHHNYWTARCSSARRRKHRRIKDFKMPLKTLPRRGTVRQPRRAGGGAPGFFGASRYLGSAAASMVEQQVQR